MALLHERNACLVVLGKVFEGVVIKLVKVTVVTVGLLLVVEKTVNVPVVIVQPECSLYVQGVGLILHHMYILYSCQARNVVLL